MRIDLHVHASERSGCSVSGEEDIVQAAIAKGLHGLAFTDHDRLVPRKRLDELNQRFAPFRIFTGIEIHTIEEEDILVIGLHDRQLDSRKWAYPALHAFVREHGGFMALAHPFRYRDGINVDIAKLLPDAVEICSTNIDLREDQPVKALLDKLGIPPLFASDAHRAEAVGTFHVRLLEKPADDPALVSVLKRGAFECETFTAPRE